MESKLVNLTDPFAIYQVEQAYWDLYTDDLQCSVHITTPDKGQLRSGAYSPIICKEGSEVVGVMLIKQDNNGIYFPVMKGERVEILQSMVACAVDHFDHLIAQTDNEYIHELASKLSHPKMKREGNTLTWQRDR